MLSFFFTFSSFLLFSSSSSPSFSSFVSADCITRGIDAVTGPDGGARHGNEPQLTPTLTLLLSQSRSFLNRQYCSGVSTGGIPYGFTEPSMYKYGASQWLWDSSSAIITNSNINVTRAQEELRTLFAQQQDDGRIAETAEWPSQTVNEMTQMPVLPFAIAAVYAATGNDVIVLKTYVPKLLRYWQWWQATRVIDDSGLVTVIHPWESGIDASPEYDEAWHCYNLTTTDPLIAWLTLYPRLSELQTVYKDEYKWNTTAILERKTAPASLLQNWFMVQDVGINALIAVGWDMMSEWAALYGDTATSQMAAQQHARMTQALQTYMWNDKLQRFLTRYHDRDGSIKLDDGEQQGVQSLFPLLLTNLTAAQTAAMIADASDPSKFLSSYPFPSVSLNSPQYTSIYTVNLMWRGPSWGFTNWLVLRGLQQQQRMDLVSTVVDRWQHAVMQEYEVGGGIWEMWNAQTGVGYGAEGLGMSNLLVDWLYALGQVNEKNVPTPANDVDVFVSDIVGAAVSSEAPQFDHGWLWLNATGSNAVIDAITIVASPSTNEITALCVTYGDLRVAAFEEGWAYVSRHGQARTNTSLCDDADDDHVDVDGYTATASSSIPRGVSITGVTACTASSLLSTTLAGLSFTFSSGSVISGGNLTEKVDCTTLTKAMQAAQRVVGVRGRASTKVVAAIGVVGYF